MIKMIKYLYVALELIKFMHKSFWLKIF